MPDSTHPPKASCRWNSLAGHYIFGETPTLTDPRTVQRPDTDLTNVHEQTHRDLINNTLYGYVLMRLHDLQNLGDAVKGRDVDSLIDKLSSRVFQCAEGSATAMELLTDNERKSKQLPSNPQALFDALPDDYKEATLHYLPIAGRKLPLPPPFGYLISAALVQAVTELSLDWAVIHTSFNSLGFWELVDLLTASKPPDEILPALIQIALQLPIDAFAIILELNRSTMAENMPQGIRNIIVSLKFGLLQASGTAPKKMPEVLDEDGRLGIFKRIDQPLYRVYPKIRPIQWQTGKVFGSVVEIDVKEPDFFFPEENVEPAHLPRRVRELAHQIEGFHLFVLNFFRFPNTDVYTVIANPTTIIDGRLDLGPTYLVSKGVSAAQMHAIDTDPLNEAHEVDRVWLTAALAILVDGGFYDWEFAASLKLPVFIRSPQFSWEGISVAAKAFAGDREFILYRVPGLEGISTGAAHVGNCTIFGLTVPSDAPPPSLGPKTGEKEIWEYQNFGAAFVVDIRTSRTETV